MDNPFGQIFLKNWNYYTSEYIKSGNYSGLLACLESAEELCASEDSIIQMTLRANKIMIHRLLARKPVDALEDLNEIGIDLSGLITYCQSLN